LPNPAGIIVGIERISQTNTAYVTLNWPANPASENVTTYEVLWRDVTAGTAATSIKTGSTSLTLHNLIPGHQYGFQIQAINSTGNPSGYSTERFVTLDASSGAVKLAAPTTPLAPTAVRTPRGAVVKWAGIGDLDLKGYDIQVSINGGTFTLVNGASGPIQSTILQYVAPPGTPIGSSLVFQVRSVDGSGNISGWSGTSSTATTDGIAFDELTAGTITAAAILSGSISTSSSGARAGMDNTGFKTYDATTNDYGAGPGVVFMADNTGSVRMKGQLMATVIQTGAIVSSTALGVPAVPGNFTGYQLDPTNGLAFYNGGTLQAQLKPGLFQLLGGTISVVGGTITGPTIKVPASFAGAMGTDRALPVARAMSGICIYNDYIYVLGGLATSAGGTPPNNGTVTCYFAHIDPVTGALGTWSASTALPAAYDDLRGGLIAYGGYLYLVGGSIKSSLMSNPASTNVWSIQIDASTGSLYNAWIAQPSLPAGRCTTSICMVGNKICVLGGVSSWLGQVQQSSYYYASVSSGTVSAWSTGSALPEVGSGGIAVYDGNGHIIWLNEAFQATHQWSLTVDSSTGAYAGVATAGVDYPLPVSNTYGDLVGTSSRYLLVQGGAQNQVDNLSAQFMVSESLLGLVNPDGTITTWSMLPKMDSVRWYGGGAYHAASGTFFAVGGFSDTAATTAVTTMGRTSVPALPNIPSNYSGTWQDGINGMLTLVSGKAVAQQPLFGGSTVVGGGAVRANPAAMGNNMPIKIATLAALNDNLVTLFDFQNLPKGYTHLELWYDIYYFNTAGTLAFYCNNNTGAIYEWSLIYNTNTGTPSGLVSSGQTSMRVGYLNSPLGHNSGVIRIANYQRFGGHKMISSHNARRDNTTAGNLWHEIYEGHFGDNNVVTQVTLSFPACAKGSVATLMGIP
jgi:hypothetical protein